MGTSGVMSQFDGLDNPAFLYIRTYPVSSFWLFEQCSKFEVSSKFNPHLYVQLGPSCVILPPLAPNPYYSDNIP
ncbi:hypothetical protein L211DRAFT_840411 [Terfezia boudieri ATCC MYA-4762]|uniref:Uncharacterized protein n=1 Tax=Terfezia boudieri ATCC MYA-4762 TaxID=1051890 RepID=A0A3N4LJY0_9PEZI|nr:hypothetical protein L211DRAFT_840411 [Terfezia boudieri ATCC MYA-4762]